MCSYIWCIFHQYHLDPSHFLNVQMFAVFAVFAWDVILHMILLFRRYTSLQMCKKLSQYAERLESSINFPGVTDLLCPLTDVTYLEEAEHLVPGIFSYVWCV